MSDQAYTAGPVSREKPTDAPAAPAPGRHSIARAASLITAGNLLSRVLGLVRESTIAGLFGKSMETSAFATAATVPTMLYDLVIGGAVSAALIPVFSDSTSRDEKSGRNDTGRIAGTMTLVALVVAALATVVLGLLAPDLVSFLGVVQPGAARERTIELVRLVLPSVIFLGLSGVITALLYARNQVAYPAFTTACYNVGIIVGAFALAPKFGVTSLVCGVLLGSALQLGLQLYGLSRAGVRLGVDFRHPAIRQILVLYSPVALGLVISQIGVIVDRNLAWRTGEDSVAVMRFATTLIQLPLGLIATATSFAVLPRLSRLAAAMDGTAEFRRTLDTGLRLALLAILPATAALVLLGEPMVRLLFERGAFDAVGTRLTSAALLLYTPQLPFVAVDQLLIFAFYARKNTLTPALVGLGGVLVYLAFGIGLSGPAGLGLSGLVLANTIQNSLHAVVLFWLLHREVGGLLIPGTRLLVGKALVAVLPVGAIFALGSFGLAGQSHPVVLLIGIGLTGTLGVAAYAATLIVLGVDEIGAGARAIAVRLGLAS